MRYLVNDMGWEKFQNLVLKELENIKELEQPLMMLLEKLEEKD